MVSRDDVERTQVAWGQGIVEIGASSTWEEAYSKAEKMILELYKVADGKLLFCPTKVSVVPFRHTLESAISYFVGNNPGYAEDSGFALEPWVEVRFENAGIITRQDNAIAMGHYFFKREDGSEVLVEYTFSYVVGPNGNLLIELHHSALPYAEKSD